MKKYSSFNTLILLFACASIASIVYGAGVPNTLNYQGTLTDNTGKPVTATAKPLTFKLYTSALGGTSFWSEAQTVPITNGQFSAVLGSSTPLPTEKFTGSTYVGVTVDAGQEMLPRQKLTSVAYALKAADAIPKGVIVMWSGALGQIPEGWALCDGVERTLLDGSKVIPPNLKDRFVVGVGDRFGTGKPRDLTGGEEEHVITINEMPRHTHTQNAHTHSDAGHYHSSASSGFSALAPTPQPNGNYSRSSGTGYVADVGTGSANIQNNTATNQNTGGGAAHNNLPPYYAIAFIMKL